jgi:hypothetical protein
VTSADYDAWERALRMELHAGPVPEWTGLVTGPTSAYLEEHHHRDAASLDGHRPDAAPPVLAEVRQLADARRDQVLRRRRHGADGAA